MSIKKEDEKSVSKDDKNFIICAMMVMILGLGIALAMQQYENRKAAIKTGCAYYSADKGDFTWKEKK